MRGTEVPITPSVLRWAIAESGYEPEEIAALIRVEPERVDAWLGGRERPKLTELKRLASKLRRPTATFLLPRPPATARPRVQFRRPGDAERSDMIPVELRYLREAARVQRTLTWALAELDAPPPRLPRLSLDQEPAAAAARACAVLGVTPDARRRWRDVYAARRGWRHALEGSGVLVFLFGLGKEGVRGFSLWDERAPLIAANTAWNPEAQVFSLLHEYGHLLTRSNSACLERGLRGRLARPTDQAERWCERFAACVLLPWDQVEAFMISNLSWRRGQRISDLDQARAVARQFKVSVTATVLRLIEERAATWDLFAAIPREWDEREASTGPRRGRRRAEIREATYGPRAARIFINAMDQDLFSRSEVLNFLRVSDDELSELRAQRASGSAR